MNGEGIANLGQRLGEQGRCLPRQIQHADLALGVLHPVVGRLGKVHQQQDREVTNLQAGTDTDARIGLHAHADIDHGTHGGIQVNLIAVLHLALPHHALGLDRLDEMLEPPHQRLVALDHGINIRRVTEFWTLLQQGGPVRTLELSLIIPFVVVEWRGDRYLAFLFVESGAVVLVQFAREHPYLLRVVTGELDVEAVDHFHETDVLADLSFLTRQQDDITRHFRHLPEMAVVVAIEAGWLVGAQVEWNLHGLDHDGQFETDVMRHVGIIQTRLGKQATRGVHQRMGIRIIRIEQGPGDAIQHRSQTAALRRICRQQADPEFAEAREGAHRQRLDTGILDGADQCLLQGIDGFRIRVEPGMHHVGSSMCGSGAIDFETGNRGAALGRVVIKRVGQMNEKMLDMGPVAGAGLEVSRSRAQEKVAAPQRAQVHDQTTLNVDKQHPALLLLHHRQRILAFQGEILGLRLEVVAMCGNTPHRPAPQPPQGEVGKQHVERVQHRAQCTRRLGKQVVEQGKISLEKFQFAEADSCCWRCRKQQCQHTRTGLGIHPDRGGKQFGHRLFADFLRYQRRTLDERDHQIGTPPQ